MAQAALPTGSGRWALQAWAMPLVGLGLFVLAVWAIHRELSAHPLSAVLAAAGEIPWADLGLAVLFTIGSYACLSLYDPMAMRWLRRPVPIGSAALAGFVSYALSHNLGLAPLTGGAARMRLYATWGLSSLDVAALFAFNAMTLALGMATAAGLATLARTGHRGRRWSIYPEGLVAVAGLVLLAAALLAAWPGSWVKRELTWRELTVRSADAAHRPAAGSRRCQRLDAGGLGALGAAAERCRDRLDAVHRRVRQRRPDRHDQPCSGRARRVRGGDLPGPAGHRSPAGDRRRPGALPPRLLPAAAGRGRRGSSRPPSCGTCRWPCRGCGPPWHPGHRSSCPTCSPSW